MYVLANVDEELNVKFDAGDIKIKVASSLATNPIAYFGTKDNNEVVLSLNCGSIRCKNEQKRSSRAKSFRQAYFLCQNNRQILVGCCKPRPRR